MIKATINNNIIATVKNSWCISEFLIITLKISLAVINNVAEETKIHGPIPILFFHSTDVTIKKANVANMPAVIVK
ncbi:hypothetical protein COS79_02760 [Candidatus Woesearchaeota archaeon CG06_land_8_20_14_3_00_33_13]|nr:MAG: hypothetical protein COS79_02760 [Candidatus Woesearchaeota archaeon CG06_land_8_20_14_3_00_33_13]